MKFFKAFLLFFLVVICAPGSAAASKIFKMTDNNYHDTGPDVHMGKIAWMAADGNDYEVYYWDGTAETPVPITQNSDEDGYVSLYDGKIAWYAYLYGEENPHRIFYWDGITTIQISDSDISYNAYPSLYDGTVAWHGKQTNTAIFYWDSTFPPQQISDDNTHLDVFPSLFNGQIAWLHTYINEADLLFWDGSQTTCIAAAYYPDDTSMYSAVSLYDGKIAWFSRGTSPKSWPEMTIQEMTDLRNSENDFEIYYWDGTTTIKITDNETDDLWPSLYEGRIAWHASDGNDLEIYYWTGTRTVQITDNDYDDMSASLDREQITWQGRDDGDYEIYYWCAIDKILVDKQPIVPGDTAQAFAVNGIEESIYPLGDVRWSIKPMTGETDVFAVIDETSGVITETSGEGWMTIRAEITDSPSCYVEANIKVGCEACETGECTLAGSGSVNLGSINVNFRLGKTEGGESAGNIFLRADTMSADLSTPKPLQLSTFSMDVRGIYYRDELRQVVSPEFFVNIEETDPYLYQIQFYDPSAMGDKVNGLYEIQESAVPYAYWQIENPDGAGAYNRLNLLHSKGGVVTSYNYLWDDGASTWTLGKNNGTQVLKQHEETVSGNRVITETTEDSSGIIASKVQKTLKVITVADESREVMIEEIVDPDGAGLTTTTSYYEEPSCSEGSCGRIESRIMPDGSWVRYEYDTDGRLSTEISSYLDSPVGAAASSARAIYYDYTPQDASDTNAPEDTRRPRLITEEILGHTVSRTYYVYETGPSGERTKTEEKVLAPGASYGNASNQRAISVTAAFSPGAADSGKILSFTHPDGRLETHTYEYGTYNAASSQPGGFSAGTGTDMRETVIHGTTASPQGVANKTVQEIRIQNHVGDELLSETWVYNGSGYERIRYTVTVYDSEGHVTDTYGSDGTHAAASWDCCNKTSETNQQGIVTDYPAYDDLGRLLTATKNGVSPYPDITTTYTYDAVGRTLTRTVTGGGLSLMTESVYDPAGRLDYSVDQAGLTTSYDYSADGLTTTVTHPGGATEITSRYLDGRIKSVTGTGVVARYYTYGANADGTQWTTVHNGTESGSNWETTVTDMLGRVARVEKPGPSGTMVTTNVYDDQGRLASTQTPGQADTLYEYDALGNMTRTGLDLDGNGVLNTAGTDRISESETAYVKDGGAWWHESLTAVYATDNDATATTTGIRRTRITGLGTEGKVAETVDTDVHGNQTVSSVFLDRDNKTRRQTVDYPDSTSDAETIDVNGLVTSVTDKNGITRTFQYDALGRRTGVVDPRTGLSETHYNTQGQVDWIEDAADHRTTFTYDALTGRKIAETDAMSEIKRYGYNARGQVDRIWGTAAEPVRYDYDDLGRMVAMHTYRTIDGFTGETFDESVNGDITGWQYNSATGLLDYKDYPDGNRTNYTYTASGQLFTRTWARTDGESPLLTTYSYDPDTGELTGIDYSDTTPDITFSYDRLGRQAAITDAVGSRTFGYNSALQPYTETIAGLYGETLIRTYDTTGIIGRSTGFSLASGYDVDYDYDDVGRLDTVAWTVDGRVGSVGYTRVANADLLEQVNFPGGLETTYTYEPHRDLKTGVANAYGTEAISTYAYQYDALGRRATLTTSGSAFDDPATPLDPETALYTTNQLNQYDEVTTNATPESLAYDADGNLTGGLDGMSYAYNGENRLSSVRPAAPVEGSTRVEYDYDYQGRRVRKTVYSRVSGAWVLASQSLFVYDGWNLVKEMTALAGQTAIAKHYVWGLDLSQSLQGAGGVGGLLAVIDALSEADLDGDGDVDGADLALLAGGSGTVTADQFAAYFGRRTMATGYYLYDGNGNVGQVVDGNGAVVAHYEYDPFGNVVNSSGVFAGENPFKFSTKPFDAETGLYYYGYRYYSTELGRWINRDPIEEEGFLVLTNSDYSDDAYLNPLIFVLNDPINSYDLYGLAGETPWDLFNVGLDVLSLCSNVTTGNVLGSLTDGGALVIDILATATPFVPGGAGAALKGYRIAKLSKSSRPLASNMMKVARDLNKGKGGTNDVKKLIRYLILDGDEAHHIIPISGPNRRWMSGALQKKMEILRQRAKAAGIDIDSPVNGVSLMKTHHSKYANNNTYYLDIWKKFMDLKGNPSELNIWKERLNEVAEDLLYATKKLK